MALHLTLDKKLSKIFDPKTSYDDRFKGRDITFITNEYGEPVTVFIGVRQSEGHIKGERYVRTIKRIEGTQEVKSSHWDLKGKAT